MQTTARELCPGCSRPVRPDELVCGLCGRLNDATPAETRAFHDRSPALPSPVPEIGEPPRLFGLPEPVAYLLIGLVVAPLFFLPFARLTGWYLAALVHEMGHAAVAWFTGRPALPTLSFDGQAMTVHADLHPVAAFMVAFGLGWAVWAHTSGRTRLVLFAVLAVTYPLAVFTAAGDAARVVGGHATELAIAAVFLWRAITGGFTESRAERALYAILGWFLVATNLVLTTSLVGSGAARAEYAQNGSYGCTNDYIVLARSYFGGSLEAVAALMTLPALAVAPLAWWAARAWRSG